MVQYLISNMATQGYPPYGYEGYDLCVGVGVFQESSIGTIKTKANVCCIQFPPDSGHLLTFGSADYKVYVYDLRSTKTPLCILGSHQKAVSYVKFVNATSLVSASTDNTLKLWDLNRANTTPHALTPCSLTYTGHTNEKVPFSDCSFDKDTDISLAF